jgi:hypothetical protein
MAFVVDSSDHFLVMVRQLVDDARIGGVPLIFGLSGGDVIEGIPSEPASAASPADELDDTGYARRVELAGVEVDLADVRRATIVHPGAD